MWNYCHLSNCHLFLSLQSKDIGVQMHEELVKVTNELYTVSKTYDCPVMPIPFLSVTGYLFCPLSCAGCLYLINPKSEFFL